MNRKNRAQRLAILALRARNPDRARRLRIALAIELLWLRRPPA